MQVQVASSSPLVLQVIVLLFVLTTITATQIFSNAEEKRVENKRGFKHPGYFSGKFGHLYSAEDFFPQGKNGTIQAGLPSSTTGPPLYRVSPAMFQIGAGTGSNVMHGALRGDSAGSVSDEFSHYNPSPSTHNERDSRLKGSVKGRQTIARLPQSIPYFEQNAGRKGKGANKPPSRFTIPPEYTRTTQPVHYTTESVTMHPTTENIFPTTWPTTLGLKGKGHHKPATLFTIPSEFTQTTEPVYYTTKHEMMHPTTTEKEIYTTHPPTPGVKKGKGHHKPASKFTIPPEYTRSTEPVHHQTEPVTNHPETTQEVYITQPTTLVMKTGKGHHTPATMFTIPPEFTQTTEPAYYPTEPATMHPTTTEKEIYTTHPPTSGIKKGKGHHKPASKFTIPPEYTRTTTERFDHHTEPEVYITQSTTPGMKKGKGHHKPPTMFTIPPEFTQTTEPAYYPTEPVTMHPTTTEKEIYTTHPPTTGIKKGKGHRKPASKFTIPPEYTRTTEPVHYQTESVTSFPVTTQEVYSTQQTTLGVMKGKGHHKSPTLFTIPPEYTQSTEPVYYPTEPATMHPTTTEKKIFTTYSPTSGIKKGKGHHKPASKFTIPPEYTRMTKPIHYSTEPTNYPVSTEEIYITQPWGKKGKGHHKQVSKFTIPSEYTITTHSINPSIFTTVTEHFETSNPADYDQSTLSAEYSTQKEEPHQWQTSTIGYPYTTHPYGNQQTDDEQFTVPGYEITKPGHSEIGSSEELLTSKPLYFTTELPIKYEVSTPGSYQFTQSYDMQSDLQSTDVPHYEEVSSTVQNTEPPYQTIKYTNSYQSTVPVEIPNESSTEPPHYEEISTISSMQNTESSNYDTDQHLDYDQATVPVEIINQFSTKNPRYEASTTQAGLSMHYTTPIHHQTDKYVDDDQVTVPVEISTQQSTKYPPYQEYPTTHSDLSMQFTDSHQDDQATLPIEISTKYSHYGDILTTHSEPSMQYTESPYHSVKYSDDDQSTLPVEIPTQSSTRYPHYEDHTTTHKSPPMQSTENFQYTDKYSDDDQATVPVEIPFESSTKNPHYEFSTIQAELPSQYTTPTHYHSVGGSDDEANVPIEVAIETTTHMESQNVGSTSSYKQLSTEFDSGLQAKVPLFPTENEEQHHINVNFNDEDDNGDDDQQSITHPYLTHPKTSTPANSPGEYDWRRGSTVHINPKKKYTVAPSDFFLTPIAPFKPVEFISPQLYKEWPSQSAVNSTGLEQVKVPDTIQVDLKGYPAYAENRPGIKGRGGKQNMISKPWYFMSRTIH